MVVGFVAKVLTKIDNLISTNDLDVDDLRLIRDNIDGFIDELENEDDPRGMNFDWGIWIMATAVEIGDGRYFLKEIDFKDFSDGELEILEMWVTDEIDNRYDDPFTRNE